MQYCDVVIHTNRGIFGKEQEFKDFPPVQKRIDLAEDIWLGLIDGEMAMTIMDTCEPKVFGSSPPYRQFALDVVHPIAWLDARTQAKMSLMGTPGTLVLQAPPVTQTGMYQNKSMTQHVY
jgi:hypothetical protein